MCLGLPILRLMHASSSASSPASSSASSSVLIPHVVGVLGVLLCVVASCELAADLALIRPEDEVLDGDKHPRGL
eukprot:3216517-Pyramimonas_sp.AAC.1